MPFASVDPQDGVTHKMPTLAVSQDRVIYDPKVFLTIDPVVKTVIVEVTETCPSCTGYGSPCVSCNGSGKILHDCGSFDTTKGVLEAQVNLEKILGVSATRDVVKTLLTFRKLIALSPDL